MVSRVHTLTPLTSKVCDLSLLTVHEIPRFRAATRPERTCDVDGWTSVEQTLQSLWSLHSLSLTRPQKRNAKAAVGAGYTPSINVSSPATAIPSVHGLLRIRTSLAWASVALAP